MRRLIRVSTRTAGRFLPKLGGPLDRGPFFHCFMAASGSFPFLQRAWGSPYIPIIRWPWRCFGGLWPTFRQLSGPACGFPLPCWPAPFSISYREPLT